MRTLDEKLTLDYIIDINKTIASHQVLKVGEIRDGVNSVGGLFEIEIPNKELILKFIDKINKIIAEGNSIKIENTAIRLFYTLVVNQWFYDGNKRTGFAIFAIMNFYSKWNRVSLNNRRIRRKIFRKIVFML